MNNHDFSQAKVGDLVTSLRYGHGVIISIRPDDIYPIFISNSGIDENNNFTINGYWYEDDFAPTLFKGHIDINSLSINYNTI